MFHITKIVMVYSGGLRNSRKQPVQLHALYACFTPKDSVVNPTPPTLESVEPQLSSLQSVACNVPI